jgi:hypothetical protein
LEDRNMIAATAPLIEGLCGTCNNSPSCFHHARRGPALFCEMFDDYVPPDTILAGRMAAPAPRPFSVRHAGTATGRGVGLCVNCEHAPRCGHAELEGGVWHCEDYE